MKLFLCSTLLVATQANFFRHVLKSHRVPHFLGAGQNHATNKFHAVFQIVHDSDLASTGVEYIDCGTADATTCMSGTPTVIHTVADLSTATVNADAAVTNVKDTNNNVYDLEYTPSVPKNHIITKLELNNHTIIEESYLCAAGKVPNPDSTVAGCDQCQPGKYAERGANSCSNCTIGKESSAGAAAQSQCVQCTAGKFNPTAGNACQDCGTGKFLAAGVNIAASSCTVCAAGKYNDVAAAASCKDCDPDSMSNGYGVGYQDDPGKSSCKVCTALASGQFVTTGICTATTDTSFNTCTTTGLSCGVNALIACVSGDIFNGNGVDAHCGAAYNCVCNNGQAGTGSNSTCNTCTSCNPGYGGSTCQQCVAGKFADGSSNATCSDCTAGKYSDAQATQCTNCDVGKYSTATGLSGTTQAVCTDCDAAKTTESAGSGLASDCVFSVTMYGYVRANFAGTCQDECVEWHGQLEDNFNANDVNQLNATGADQALCNLLKKTGEMIKQLGC